MSKTLSSFILVLLFSACFNLLAATGQVDINRADAETLAATLNGVGEARARAIVAYRTQHGPFRSADELTRVKGIGERMLEKNRALIRVSGND